MNIGAERDGVPARELDARWLRRDMNLIWNRTHTSLCRLPAGLLRPWFSFKGEEHDFKKGDKVQAHCPGFTD